MYSLTIKNSSKFLIYIQSVLGISVAIIGMIVPETHSVFIHGLVKYFLGILYLEGYVILLASQISLYLAIIHATRADRVGTTTLCACLPLLLERYIPPDMSTLLAVPVLNLRVVNMLPDALDMPPGGLLLLAVILWNFETLRQPTPDGSGPPVSVDDWCLSSWLECYKWRIISYISACFFILACIISPIVQNPPGYLWQVVLPFVAAATYTFVSTNSTRGTAGLATGAWIIGFATLQYDTALTGIAFPTATLLTISAAALWLSKRTHETPQNRSNRSHD